MKLFEPYFLILSSPLIFHHLLSHQAAATLNEAFRTRSSIDKHYVCVVNGDLYAGETKGGNTAKDQTGDKGGNTAKDQTGDKGGNQAGKKSGNKTGNQGGKKGGKGVDKVGNQARVDMDVSGGTSSSLPSQLPSASSSSSAPITLRHLIQKTTAERVKVYTHPATTTTTTTTTQKNPRKDLVEAILTYQPICSFASPGPTATATAAATSPAKTTAISSNTPRQTLVKIALDTGRKHQIRAQMSHIGHPIVGDVKYGASQGMSQHSHHITTHHITTHHNTHILSHHNHMSHHITSQPPVIFLFCFFQ